MDMNAILRNFKISGEPQEYQPFGDGHINDTFLITLKNSPTRYILQRINHAIFLDVPGLMRNIQRVTDHIKQKLLRAGVEQIERRVLQFIPTDSGQLFYQDTSGNYWRLCLYIPGSRSYNIIPDAQLAYKGGRAFGEFLYLLQDLPANELNVTIPNFHNLPFRLEQLKEALHKNRAGRKTSAVQEIEAVIDRTQKMNEIFSMSEQQTPLRVTHNDTKFNNVLFDKDNNPLCVIDLDTVMPGRVFSDFGDAIRTGANTGAEDDPQLERVSMNKAFYEAYTRGFLEKTRSILSDHEIESLAHGALILTFMQAVRFLTDYLNGDTYYKIEHPLHNLQRTRAQLKLLKSMEESFEWMQQIVKKYAAQLSA
ncbi:aminoglycoside phosphotransferase [Caldithrix abyssi DSM 13497]|uniref:Aminoglycoside phosphotransferase n=2 Tax=Caldithrix abyssi TaxID=187145 RepID=H1XSB4_CALAY|nr:Phosphotransferase enzyme family protein [Caldithrix abyssi DSM 13497]EHO40278.1 aminoglycoside phosphotransferase [Caldithrix abyssi DSM 13497]